MPLAATATGLPSPLQPPPGFPPSPSDGWITLVEQAYAVIEKDEKAVDQ